MRRLYFNTKRALRFPVGLIFLFSLMKDTYSNPYESLLVNRSILGRGLHRILQYNVTFPEVRGPTQILIVETLPRDVYLDPYELSKRITDNEIKIITDEPLNSEIPAYKAQPFDIQLCSISQTNSHEIELPLHLRYQLPNHCKVYGKRISRYLGETFVYIRTQNEGLSNTHCFNRENDGSWIVREVVHITSFQVPVGCMEDFYFVIASTACGIAGATFLISYMLWQSNKKL